MSKITGVTPEALSTMMGTVFVPEGQSCAMRKNSIISSKSNAVSIICRYVSGESCLVLPLETGERGYFTFGFFSKKSSAYQQEHVNFI